MLLNVNIAQKQSVTSSLPMRGLSLGLLLTLSTLFIVSLVMGVVTYVQHSIELKSQHKVHENLLRESLSPLVSQIETATTIEEIQHDIEQFHLSYGNRGYPSHEVILVDESKKVIASTHDGEDLDKAKYSFKASVPITLQVPDHKQSTLIVFKDVTEYKSSVKRQWIFWIIHMAITLVTIFLFLYPAIYFLVTKPIKNLVKGVQKMEMGYWGGLPPKN